MASSRKKKILAGCGTVLLVALVALFVMARPLLFPRKWDVVPITTDARYQDARLLARAMQLPVARRYASQLVYQPNPSFCGPTTVANVLRSFGHDAATPQAMIEGTSLCRFGICLGGISLDELQALMSQRTCSSVDLLRDLSLPAFREQLRHTNEEGIRYTINFDRGPLFGRSGGHHSPIGGYLEDEDLVLVLDVNDKYHPWLVRSERLFAAMNTVDGSSGKRRGLLRISHDGCRR